MLNFQSIESAAVYDEYFPYFIVGDALSQVTDRKQLVSSLPDIDQGGSFPCDTISLNDDIQNLVQTLEGDKMRHILEQKFSINLEGKKPVTTFRGFSRMRDGKPHTDSKTKVLTVLFYLNENWDAKSGRLRLLKGNDNIDDFTEEVIPKLGSMVAFKITGNDWHGYQPIEAKRLSLQLNYLHENCVTHHNVVHNLTALLKGILRKIRALFTIKYFR